MVAAQHLKCCVVRHAGSIPALGTIILYNQHRSGCGSDGRVPRLGRGGPQFESGHPDFVNGMLK